jgi:hypothetical protein
MPMRSLAVCLLGLALVPVALAQHAPHAHGVAELRVAVDGKRLHIELESPLDNLVGFEHAPKTARERAALAAAEETLRGGDALFVLPAEAGCVLEAVELASPYPQSAGDDPGHGRDDEEAHSDMDVAYEFDCANPAALTTMRVNLTVAFPRMQRIQAETATPAGQGKVTLDKSRRTLPL